MMEYRRNAAALLTLTMFSLSPAWAGEREMNTLNEACELVGHMCAFSSRTCIPPHLLHESVGVAILPNVLKAGLLVDGRFGRGVVVARRPDGTWGNPVFVTLEGIGIGGQAGVESTDLVLIFKTPHSLDRILEGKGKLTLGSDLTVAVGPVGRDAEVATDGLLRAEILSYSRSRGLYAGLSVEGAKLQVDHKANESFYDIHGGRPADVMKHRGIATAERLRIELAKLSESTARIYMGPPIPVYAAPVPVDFPPPQYRR